MATVQDQIAVPGQLLGPASRFVPGAGTHLADGQVYASLLGHVSVRQPAEAGKKTAMLPKRLTRIMVPSVATKGPDGAAQGSSLADVNKATVSVSRARIAQGGEVLPDVGNTALCRVVRIAQRQAVVAILVVGDVVLEAEWQGVIRAQDVRATEKDRVKIYESFRPGDIVRAQVISLGDQANYYLSTASNSLGVVMATSEAGNPMYPVSWKEYVDPETGLSEPRKVARPF
ncbi:exosome complex subunit [Grosmannia clavigera kw1407]|uniref:Exosome complex subunit n=1 Tax=Grosmannia clavigera (strain kw1407 / UAMH 11150) TaxID=655863 RepID=F0XIB6_GROCL|nr:exosome complex subunit [Grosmannia clavigera kw1407]EFX02909.1 exosome complex subunit [Grosmannia clavigera kw1407]